jgi:hypothetical protein
VRTSSHQSHRHRVVAEWQVVCQPEDLSYLGRGTNLVPKLRGQHERFVETRQRYSGILLVGGNLKLLDRKESGFSSTFRFQGKIQYLELKVC